MNKQELINNLEQFCFDIENFWDDETSHSIMLKEVIKILKNEKWHKIDYEDENTLPPSFENVLFKTKTGLIFYGHEFDWEWCIELPNENLIYIKEDVIEWRYLNE